MVPVAVAVPGRATAPVPRAARAVAAVTVTVAVMVAISVTVAATALRVTHVPANTTAVAIPHPGGASQSLTSASHVASLCARAPPRLVAETKCKME